MISITSLTLALTGRCNLRCGYCYLDACETGAEMADETIDKALGLVADDCHIQLTGGEPCLAPAKIVYLVEKAARKGAKWRLAIQSNGTLFNRELVQLFKEYDVQVGISLDGPPDVHERLRGRADATLRGLQLLAGAKVPFRVTTVVSRGNIGHLDRLALLLAGWPNCLGLGLDLLVHKGRASTMPAANSEEIGQGMQKLTQALTFINKRRVPKLRLRELDYVNRGAQQKFCRAATGESLAVAPDGRLFPCGQAMGAKDLCLGTIDRPRLVNQPLTGLVLTDPHCRDCPLAGRCPGDCPGRLYFNDTCKDNPACVMYRALAGG